MKLKKKNYTASSLASYALELPLCPDIDDDDNDVGDDVSRGGHGGSVATQP